MKDLFKIGLAATLTIGFQATAQEEDAVELDAFISEEVPVEELIIPTARNFDSVYGMSRSVLDTPRNITIISREQLDAIAINSVRDFTKLTSSSYTRTNFGAPSNPDIRTQIADMMWNGIRKGLTSNGNGMPLNFNSVESVNIVKGPASVVHGASMYVGGYADLVTKRPFFDEFRGEVSVTLGSYDKKAWTVDVGGPLSDKLAYRLSYSGEDSDSYYDNSWLHSHALYGAVTYRPNDTYELFLNAEFVYANYTEHFGVNRPTQDLIDNGWYITGVNNNPAPDANGLYFDANGNEINFGNLGLPAGDAAPVSDPQNSRWVVTGFPITNRMVWEDPVQVDRRWRLSKPGDDSEGVNWTLQAIQTWNTGPDTKVVNNTVAHYIKRDTFSSYHYSEIIDPSFRLENRTEFQYVGDVVDFNTGVSFSYQSVEAYNHFFWEPANVWDLSRDQNFIDVYNSVNFPDFAGEVPGWPGRYATPGFVNGDTNDSDAFGIGPFIQADFKFGNFSVLTGIRWDILNIDSADPIAIQAFGFPEDAYSDSTTVTNQNLNISPTLKISENVTAYATYNYSENPGGAVANGGGFGQLSDADGDGNYTLDKSRLQQESELIEFGAKSALLDGKLFIGGALFKQERSNLQLDGSLEEFTTEGFEIEANYQPNKNFFMTVAFSLLDSSVNGPSFDVNNTSPWLPDQVPFYLLGPGEYRRQGTPKHTFNTLLSYKFDSGFGVQLAGYWTSDINNNVAGSIVIPDQYNVDLTLFYTAETWEVRLAILNLTDEENWGAPNAVYGGESIMPELPVRAELTGTFKF